jgi:hypothetical protein
MWSPDSWTADAWSQYLASNWYIIAAAILVIIIVIKAVKTVLKWLLVAVVVIGLVLYSGYNLDDLAQIKDQATLAYKDQLIKTMAGEAADAKYQDNPDGSYTIKTPSLELSGFPNTGEIQVKLGGVSIGTWKLEGEVRDFVIAARNAARQ